MSRPRRTLAISARLHLSERTVENHLYRAYAKLGVAGRSGLRTALAIDPPDGPQRRGDP